MEVLQYTQACIPPTTTAQQKGAFVCNGKVRFFTKAKVKQAEQTWWHILEPARKQLTAPLEGAVSVEIVLIYPHKKSTPKKDLWRILPISTRPDVDNLVKSLLDTMTHMAFWKDDSQITILHIEKWRGPEPKLELTIQKLEE